MNVLKEIKKLTIMAIFTLIIVACTNLKTASAAVTVTEDQIANEEERKYVNKAISYYLRLTEPQKSLENGEPVIFLFEGASNNQTADTNIRTAAVCIVIKKVQGNLNIVYFNDLCTTLPDNPTNYDIATTKDGIYHVRAVDHGLEKGHEKYATGKYAALNVQAISSDGSYSDYIPAVRWGETDSKKYYDKTAVAINVHTRGEKTICSGGWSQGCLLIDYARDGVNSKGIPEYERFIKAVYPTSVTTKEGDGQLTLGAYKNVKISRIQTGRYNSVGTLVIDRFLYQDEMDALYGVPAAVDLIVAFSVAAEPEMCSIQFDSLKLAAASVEHKKDCEIIGVISSDNSKINKIEIDVYDANNVRVIDKEVAPKKKSYDLSSSTIDKYLSIDKLSVGEYKLVITATDANGSTDSREINFSVHGIINDNSSFVAEMMHGVDTKIGGSLSCCCKFSTVKASIYSKNGTSPVDEEIVKPSGKTLTFSSSKLNSGLDFSKLPIGDYELRLVANTECGDCHDKTYPFIVNHCYTGDATFATSFTYGKSATIGGKITSCCKITEITATLITESGSYPKTVNPKKTSYSFSNFKLDGDLKVSALPAGDYTLNIHAVNEAGTTYDKKFDFTITHGISSSASFPAIITHGEDVSISGKVTSTCCYLDHVKVIVADSNGVPLPTSLDNGFWNSGKDLASSKKKSYTLSSSVIDKTIDFGALNIGDYKLIIEATDVKGGYYSKTINFSVQHSISVAPSLEKTTITEGSGCKIKGTVSSCCNLTSVTGVITTESDDHVGGPVEITPNKKSIKLQDTAIRSGLMNVAKTAGKYKLTITAVNEAQKVESKTIEFTVTKKSAGTLSVNAGLASTSIIHGSGCNITGTVTSNYAITSVSGVISTAGGQHQQSYTIEPKTTTVYLKDSLINSNLKFGKLATGSYKLVISAVDESGANKSQTISFNVVDKSSSALTVDVSLASQSLKQGSSCKISGVVTSGYNITSIKGSIVATGSGTNMQTEVIYPNVKTVYIEDTNINYALRFAGLSKGSYCLTVTAADSSGTIVTDSVNFTIY